MGIRARKLTEASSVIFSEIHFACPLDKLCLEDTKQYPRHNMPKITDDNVQTKIFSQIFTKNLTCLNVPLSVILCSIFNFDQLHMFQPFH